ncbi:MAG: hypothetical protein KIH71_012705, partial [Roseobacter sp.]|nr:hypothetical protein [Roseobacter sp.]
MVPLSFATRLTRKRKRLIFLAIDALTVPFALGLAFLILGPSSFDSANLTALALLTGLLMGGAALTSHHLGLTRIKLNSYEMQGIARTGKFAAILGVGAYLLNSVIGALSGLSVFVLFTMVLLLCTVTLRMIMRQMLIHAYQKDSTRTRILVYG